MSKVQDQMETITEKLGLGLENQQIVDVVYSSVEDLVESGLEGSDEIIYFYATCLLACAFGQLSLDRKASGFTFGFKELETVYRQLELELAVREVENHLKSQLAVSDLRSNSLVSLSSSELESCLVDDLATVSKALDLEFDSQAVSNEVKESLVSVEDESFKRKLEALQTSGKLKADIHSLVSSLLDIYDFAFEAGYELDRYEGVIVGSETLPMVILQGETAVQPSYTSSYYAGEAMFSPLEGVKVSTSRQVNLQDILESEEPVYYPYKMLEFALSRKVTVEKDDLTFPSVPMKWRGSDGQRKAIENYLTKRAWEYLVLVCDTYRDGYFWTEEVSYFGKGATRPITPLDNEIFKEYLAKFKGSFATFAIMKSHVGMMEDEKWASAEWVVSAPMKYLGESEFTPQSFLYTEVFDYGGEFEPPLTKEFKDVVVSHYSHIANPDIAESEPLFAFKALESLQRKGEKLTYGYQLLGKGLDGRILTASNDLTAAVNAGAKLVLVYWAGSRSGKGVSISNGLAVSIANGRPVFGGDGKPDTMVPYYIAFGGADSQGIPKGYFIQAGVFNKSAMPVTNDITEQLDWDNNPTIMGWFDKSIPKWFSGVSSLEKRYTGSWGDMAFYRHMLLVMGIVSLRATVRSSDTGLYNKLGGDEGILGIFDEVTNWSNLFGSSKLTSSGGWFSNILSDKELEELQDSTETYLGGIMKEQALRKFEKTIANKSDDFRNRAYLRDIYDKMDESMQLLNKLKKAGFQNEESLRSSIYIVGQSFNLGGFDKLPRNKGNDASSFKGACDYKNGSVDAWLYSLLNLDTGFMVGYKGTEDSQYWSSQKGSDSNRYLTASSRRFAYFGGVDYPTIRDESPQNRHLARSVNSQREGGAVYFKPYLILGDSKGSCIEQMEKNLGSKAESIKSRNCNPNNPSEWDDRVGVLGYLKALGSSDISRSFVRAREIADMVVERLGYPGSYLEFLLDLNPEWNFSCEDIILAFTNQEVYQSRKRQTVYAQVEELLDKLEHAKESEVGSSQGGISTHEEGLTPKFAKKEFAEVDEEVSEPLSEATEEPVLENNSTVDNLEGESKKWTREEIRASESVPPQNVAATLANQLGVSESDLLSVLQSAFGLQGSVPPSSSKVDFVDDLNGRKVMSRVASHKAEASRLEIKDDKDLQEYLLEDIYNYFGDWSRVRKIEVVGRQLYFNGLLYEPDIVGVQLSPSVSPYSVSLWNARSFGELFSWETIGSYLSPTSITFDSMEYAYSEFDQMKSRTSSEVVENAFKRYPTLQDLQIGSFTFKRDEIEEMITEKQPFLSSYDRRRQVFSRGNSAGRSFRQRRWQKAREHMAKGRTGRAMASAVGAGLGVGFQGASHVGGFLNKFARVAKKAGASVAEGWKEQSQSKH